MIAVDSDEKLERGSIVVLEILTAIRDGIAFLMVVAYNTGVSLIENGMFMLVFIVVMLVLMITGWRRDKPTI